MADRKGCPLCDTQPSDMHLHLRQVHGMKSADARAAALHPKRSSKAGDDG